MDRRDFHGEAFNFGTETPVTVTGIVALIFKLMGEGRSGTRDTE